MQRRVLTRTRADWTTTHSPYSQRCPWHRQSEANADVNSAAGTVAWSEYYFQRIRLQETTKINRGLFSLKQCIDALNDQAAAVVEGRAPPYIPYQDSKLTMLLSSALGGNSKTLVIVTASLDPNAAVETVQVCWRPGVCSAGLT